MARFKALNRAWDQEGLVRHVIEQIPDNFSRRQALRSEEAVLSARPIIPLPTEQQFGVGADHGLPQIIEHSPRAQSYVSPEPADEDQASIEAQEGDDWSSAEWPPAE